MPARRKALVMFGAMCATSAMGWALKRPRQQRKTNQHFVLDELVPSSFGGWRQHDGPKVTANPQAQKLLDKIYSQILERIYVNADGYAIMLAIAYGDDQRATLEAHRPEVCYPAQGFKVLANESGDLNTSFGSIPVKRLNTVNGQRIEPLTYWFTVANTNVQTRVEKRLIELQMALTGQVPDGLLFRVSSIDGDQAHAWQMQQRFVNDLLQAVPESTRIRLAGVKG